MLRRRKPADFRSRIGPDHLEVRCRDAILDPRENLTGEIQDGVDVRGVIKAADEDDVAAILDNRDARAR